MSLPDVAKNREWFEQNWPEMIPKPPTMNDGWDQYGELYFDNAECRPSSHRHGRYYYYITVERGYYQVTVTRGCSMLLFHYASDLDRRRTLASAHRLGRRRVRKSERLRLRNERLGAKLGDRYEEDPW